jgi:predicted PurR-regulated permease PerM
MTRTRFLRSTIDYAFPRVSKCGLATLLSRGPHMSGRKTAIVFLLILLSATLVLAYSILSSFLRPLAFALIIGIGFYPLHVRISGLLSRRTTASLISTVVVLLIFVIPAALLASAASGDLIRTAHYVSDKSASEGGVVAYLSHSLDRPMNWLEKHVDLEKSGLKDILDSAPAALSRLLLGVGTSIVAGLATFAGEAVITFFVLFFVFRDGVSVMNQIAMLLPLSPDRTTHLLSRIRESVVGNLYGILAVALIQGFLIAIAMLIVRAPSPLLLGTAAGALSTVPLVGSALVWVPMAIFLLVGGHWLKAIFILAWGAIVVGTADNIIRPLVIVGRVKLHPVLLLFSLIGGVKQFGFIGLFVGPVAISVLLALVDMLREEVVDSMNPANGAHVTEAPQSPGAQGNL